ncbi:MAG: radical SAM protein [Carboxydocellales bacterium]
MSKRILLITPPYHTGIIEITGKWPPLSLAYLAGALRNVGHSVEIYDIMTKNHTLEEARQQIIAYQPEVVMIGAFTACINAALKTLQAVKQDNPQVITAVGGIHATFCWEEILKEWEPWVDLVVVGEGEVTVVELMSALEIGVWPDQKEALAGIPGLAYWQHSHLIKTAERPLVTDIDQLKPAWDLLEWNDYYYRITGERLAVVGSSRGCPHKCSFCSQYKFWCSIYRARSPKSFVDEIELLRDKYGVKMCMLADEYPTYNRERFEAILDLIIARNLGMHFTMETRVEDILRDEDILDKYRRAGLIHVYVGVESPHQEVLDLFRKESKVDSGKKAVNLLNEAGIITECSFILGHPEETRESIDATLQLAIEYNPDLAHFLLITPWPYADIYPQLEPFIIERDYSKYHLVHPIVKPKNLTINELWEKVIYCFAQFYKLKAKQYFLAPDSFKKDYMLKSIRIMHENFFTDNFGTNTIDIPEQFFELMKTTFKT